MHPVVLRVVCLAAILLPAAAAADLPPSRSQPAASRLGAHVRQSADLPPRAQAADRWRYQFKNGHWWYWRDGEWSYWTGTSWIKYSADSYRRWYAERRLAEDEAELARLKAMLRSMEMNRSRRGSPRVRDPDSYFPFESERGGLR